MHSSTIRSITTATENLATKLSNEHVYACMYLNYVSVTGIPCLESSIEGYNGPSVFLLPRNKSPVLLAVHRWQSPSICKAVLHSTFNEIRKSSSTNLHTCPYMDTADSLLVGYADVPRAKRACSSCVVRLYRMFASRKGKPQILYTYSTSCTEFSQLP